MWPVSVATEVWGQGDQASSSVFGRNRDVEGGDGEEGWDKCDRVLVSWATRTDQLGWSSWVRSQLEVKVSEPLTHTGKWKV